MQMWSPNINYLGTLSESSEEIWRYNSSRTVERSQYYETFFLIETKIRICNIRKGSWEYHDKTWTLQKTDAERQSSRWRFHGPCFVFHDEIINEIQDTYRLQIEDTWMNHWSENGRHQPHWECSGASSWA